MATPTTISLAFLKVNWDSFRKGYLDNFIPIIAESIRLLPNDIVTLMELQSTILNHFGLTIPQNAIEVILRRMRKHRYVDVEEGVYKRNNDKLATLDFSQVRQQVLEKHDSLINGLIDYCEKSYGFTWSVEEAEAALQFYLKDNELLVVSAAIHGTTIPAVADPKPRAKYYVGSFIQYLEETQSSLLEHFETVVKGNMLANAIFLPDPNRASKKFRKTAVYFDTTFLIYALGYAGSARKEPCIELLKLLYETGAELRCFRHTLDESKGILNYLAQRLAKGQALEAYGASAPSVEYFLSKGYNASDIEMFLLRLQKDLQSQRISVIEKPTYVPEYTIDEEGLEEAFKNIPYRSDQARKRDVASMSAIMTLRKGQEFSSVEECRAIFVTSNTALASECAKFFCDAVSVGNISPCLTDYSLTNLLWLKKPLAAPDLPRKRIIADCYAATQPDERMWRRYLSEIETLDKDGEVTEDDCYLLRYSLEAKQALMELTQGDVDVFSRATIPEILQVIRSRIQAELRKQLEAERARAEKAERSVEEVRTELEARFSAQIEEERKKRKEAEESVGAVKAREIERDRRIKGRANQISHMAVEVIKYLVVVGLVIGVISTFPWDISLYKAPGLRFLFVALQIIVLILIVSNLIWGTTVKAFMRNFEIKLASLTGRLLQQISR